MPRCGPRLPRRTPGRPLIDRQACTRSDAPADHGRGVADVRGALSIHSRLQSPLQSPFQRPLSSLARPADDHLAVGVESRVEAARFGASKRFRSAPPRWSSEPAQTKLWLDCAPFRGPLATLHFSTSARGRSVEPDVDESGSVRGLCGRTAWTRRRSSTASFHRTKRLWTTVDEREPTHGSSTHQRRLPTRRAPTQALHHTPVGSPRCTFIHNSTCPLLRRRIL